MQKHNIRAPASLKTAQQEWKQIFFIIRKSLTINQVFLFNHTFNLGSSINAVSVKIHIICKSSQFSWCYAHFLFIFCENWKCLEKGIKRRLHTYMYKLCMNSIEFTDALGCASRFIPFILMPRHGDCWPFT